MGTDELEFSPQMEKVINQLTTIHGLDLAQQGAFLVLAMPMRRERWLIINMDGERISVTHCWVEAEDELAPDLDMVFMHHAEGWEPIELLYTDDMWDDYMQAAQAVNIPIYHANGDIRFASFTEQWASKLQQQGWLTRAYLVQKGEVERKVELLGRMVGCQSTNHTHCYGELWQCMACGKTVCYAEGTDNYPELCDDCWVKRHGNQEEQDVPF